MALALLVLSTPLGKNDVHISKKRAAHVLPTPRFGGLALFLGMVIGVWFFEQKFLGIMLLAAFPVFIVGLCDDVWYSVSPFNKLAITTVSAGLYILVSDLWVNFYTFDLWFGFTNTPIIALVISMVFLCGLTHAFNIVDGLNGLALFNVLISSLAIAYLSWLNGVSETVISSLTVVVCCLSVLALNYPFAKVFIGDCGSYLCGLLIGFQIIFLHNMAPHIHELVFILIVFWPIAETVHSIFRRWLSAKHVVNADMMHTHHVFMRLIDIILNPKEKKKFSNPMASAIIVPLSALPAIVGCFNSVSEPLALLLFIGMFLILFCSQHVVLVAMARKRKKFLF